MRFIKPQKLRPGDTVAIISPSWGGPSLFPHIFERGLAALEREFGLVIKELPTARMAAHQLYQQPKLRAADINEAFADPTIKAIITSIGGNDSVRVLPYLNPEIIKSNPKILLGYSDATTLLTYCNQLGLVTFHGPAVMAGFAQLESLPQDLTDHIQTMLFDAPAQYNYEPYAVWSEGYPDWQVPENTGAVNPLKPNKLGWSWVQGKTVVQGELFGGSIEVLEMLKASIFWPRRDFWQGKILFLETSEEKPLPRQVKHILRSYGIQGVFNHINGLIIGRPRDYSANEKLALQRNVRQVIAQEFARPDLPVVMNMDFGHTDPQWILPLGVQAELDCQQHRFRLLESPLTP